MSMFDDRQKAAEGKHAKKEELEFKVQSRAVRLFGLWAAGQLGKSGADADAYAEEVIESDFDEPGIQDVLRKVKKDLDAKGIDMTTHHLENQFRVNLDEARKALAG